MPDSLSSCLDDDWESSFVCLRLLGKESSDSPEIPILIRNEKADQFLKVTESTDTAERSFCKSDNVLLYILSRVVF